MSEPSPQAVGGEQESVELPPAPDAVSIDFSAAEGLPRADQRRLWSASLVAALSAHALIFLVVSWVPGLRPVGAGGTELEAIDIDIVSAKVLESRLASAEAGSAPPEHVDHSIEGGETPAEASLATVDQRPSEPDPQVEPAGPKPDLVIPDAKEEEPPPEPADVALAIADKQPEESDSREPEVEAERTEQPSEPDSAAPSQASEASEAAEEGGAAARGMEIVAAPGQKAAAASPGVANEYAKAVIETLARRKPRATAGVRGTVRISFTVDRSGEVREARVLKSSGRTALDEAALTAVRSARFPAPPPALADSRLSYVVPYIFR